MYISLWKSLCIWRSKCVIHLFTSSVNGKLRRVLSEAVFSIRYFYNLIVHTYFADSLERCFCSPAVCVSLPVLMLLLNWQRLQLQTRSANLFGRGACRMGMPIFWYGSVIFPSSSCNRLSEKWCDIVNLRFSNMSMYCVLLIIFCPLISSSPNSIVVTCANRCGL